MYIRDDQMLLHIHYINPALYLIDIRLRFRLSVLIYKVYRKTCQTHYSDSEETSVSHVLSDEVSNINFKVFNVMGLCSCHGLPDSRLIHNHGSPRQ